MELIDKSALAAEIKSRIDRDNERAASFSSNSEHDYLYRVKEEVYKSILHFLDTLEVIDPYEECIQYSSVKDGIQAHAETYSFNIESELFNQLTKEQQGLWRKEIEQACISGGNAGVELARDPRYKENAKVKEVDLTDRKPDWRPSKKQIESLAALVRYNFGVFDYQKLNEVVLLYEDLTKILDYETNRQK